MNKQIRLEFISPDNSNELLLMNDELKVLKKRLNDVSGYILSGKYNNEKNSLEKDIIKLLYKVGNMTIPISRDTDILYDKYLVACNDDDVLATRAWTNHKAEIFEPYDYIKTQCHKLIEKIKTM